MDAMYENKIDLPALARLAQEEAPKHRALYAAGRFWAAEMNEPTEQFAAQFAFHFVQSIMLVGRSMNHPYEFDILGPPLASQILIAACSDLHIDPMRLPQYLSVHVTPNMVTWQRSGEQPQIWWEDLGTPPNRSTVFDGKPLC
jgi:hypothetical protein